MEGFFVLLIGYFVFLIATYHDGNKVWKKDAQYQNSKKQFAISHNKPVWFYGYEKDKKVFIETNTGRRVFQGTDIQGLKRWYYTDTKKPMKYPEDKRILLSLERNKSIALTENKKWCEVNDFWDDSVISWNKKAFYYTYLNDYDCNNVLNQKVYLKNMRPFQLYLFGTSIKDNEYTPLFKKQYLIRFGNTNYFNFKTQHCIFDKQLYSTDNIFWSKWYAITEEEFLELVSKDKEYFNKRFENLFTLKQLKPIHITDIAFNEGINKIKWGLVNCGIKKAFDNEGNFIGE